VTRTNGILKVTGVSTILSRPRYYLNGVARRLMSSQEIDLLDVHAAMHTTAARLLLGRLAVGALFGVSLHLHLLGDFLESRLMSEHVTSNAGVRAMRFNVHTSGTPAVVGNLHQQQGSLVASLDDSLLS